MHRLPRRRPYRCSCQAGIILTGSKSIWRTGRAIVSPAHSSRRGGYIAGCCGPGNTQPKGTVTLDTLDVGHSAAGRYSLVFPSGQILDDAFEAAWKEQPWMVQPCPTPPDSYPQRW